nr:hypothetical protein BHI3_02550 [Bacteriovorax sp. HI3]
MSKAIKTFTVSALLALSVQNTHAEKVAAGSKELPLEVNLLIDNLQNNNPDIFPKILPDLLNIDRYARSMSKEDIFLIGKIEVYKTLLKNYDAAIKQPVDGTSLTTLKAALGKTKDNFTKWFLQALLKDCEDLMSNKLYKEFLLQKNNGLKIEKVEYRKLEKKGELLQYWISKINPNAQDFPDTLKNDLTPKMLETLKNISRSFELMAKESSLSPLAPELKDETELKFFAVKDVAKTPAKPAAQTSESKSVEEILAPVTDVKPEELPQPTQENWLEDENTPASLQNLPKPSNDADWLEDF